MSHLFGHQYQSGATEPTRTLVYASQGHSAPPPVTVSPLWTALTDGGPPGAPQPRRRPGDGFTPTVAAVVMLNEDPWRRTRRLGEPPDPPTPGS